MANENIIHRLNVAFPDGPPTDAAVRDHTVTFRADHWLKRWPEGLDVPPFLEPGAELQVSRQGLFDHATTVNSPQDALEFYVWIAGWGTGKGGGRPVARSAKVLQTPNVAELLWQSFSNLHDHGAVNAYRRLRTTGEDRIKYLGPAFFTKWLYFSGYDTWDDSSLAPLILDKRVAHSLGWSRTSGWKSHRYEEYLNQVEALRQAWAPDETPHVIEYALFNAR